MDTDADIGREAVERYVVIDADGENDTNAAGYVDLVQYIREAIRGDIEREVIERAISKGEVMRVVDLPGHDFIVFEES